ncbi:histidine kinase [Hamadaea sp. NPDC050747]|uniref:sensor histidine kinase n=1 Tax=Hamadaea sp. NPDC050747 TaxID=3155789 RepID=UPI003410B4ED
MQLVRGFGRSCAVVAVTLLVPATWATAIAVMVWWRNPWTWFAPVMLAVAGTAGLSGPVCRWTRALVARWSGVVIPAGHRKAPPIVQMANGYWWNGFTYARSSRQAQQEQELRLRWRDPATWRDVRFTLLAPVTAGIAALVPVLGLVMLVVGLISVSTIGYAAAALGLATTVAAAPHAWKALQPTAVRFLGPSPSMALADRVRELTTQRADVTVAQAAEIRRIERDLHDGAQARLVGLGLSLATAEKLMERDPEQAKELMRQARAGAAASLSELRELVKGISPPVLTERGLVDAVRALALDCPLKVTVDADSALRMDPPVEAAVYFGVSEVLTNAVRHSGATKARVSLARREADLVVEITDDGHGGADLRADGGLAGLRRRLAVFDGTLDLDSPVGGPTRVTMVVPCASW